MGPLSDSPNEAAARALMSSLCDGDAAAAGPGIAAWAQDETARRAWHEYHLIGDVLRSDDLAMRPQGDAAFLAALRTRLAQEPVPLAPQPLALPTSTLTSTPMPTRAVSGMGWRAPAAVAAGFAAVAVVIGSVQMGAGSSSSSDDVMAGAGVSSRGVSTGTLLVSTPATAGNGTGAGTGTGVRAVAGVGFVVSPESLMIRNPQLDAHLRAHQAARLRAAAEPSGSSLRDSPNLIPPDLAATHVLTRVPPSRMGFGNRESAP